MTLPTPLGITLAEARRALGKSLLRVALLRGLAAGAGVACILVMALLFGGLVGLLFETHSAWPSWVVLLFGLVPPGLGLLVGWAAAQSRRPGPYSCAMALDQAAGTKNRLATAVEFWARPDRAPFEEAAVLDGVEASLPLDALTLLETSPPSALVRRAIRNLVAVSVLLVPVLLIPLLAPEGLAGLEEPMTPLAGRPPAPRRGGGPPELPRLEPAASLGSPAGSEGRPEQADAAGPGEGEAATTPEAASPRHTPGAPGAAGLPGRGGERAPKVSGGDPKETAESQTGDGSGSAGAQGSPAGGAGKPGPRKEQEPKRPSETRPGEQSAPRSLQGEEPRAGGSMQAGTSRMGGSLAPISHQWESQESGGEEDSGGDEEDQEIDDEERRSRQRGGMQPSLRDRRPPPSRDLGLSQPGDEPGKGRGGPTPPKKSRGTAGMILGLPIPDTVKGLPNPGTSRVEQERTGPRAAPEPPGEGQSPLDGDRGESPLPGGRSPVREAALIGEYFKRLRGSALKAPEGSDR